MTNVTDSRTTLSSGPSRGFTLIELLVVIAIIGMLASIVLASLNAARSRAAEAKVVHDFRQIERALQLYYDKHGNMPVYHNGNCCNGNHTEKYQRMAQDLVDEGYLPSIPATSGYSYSYYYYGGNIGGILVTSLKLIDSTTVPPYGSCRPFDNNWCSSTQASKNFCICNR